MAQAPGEHGSSLDLLSLFQDLLCAPEVDVGGRQVSKALVVALVVVIFDKGADLALEISGQEVMLEQNTVLHGLVPSLDLALGLWVVWRTTDMVHALVLEIIGQVASDVGRAVVAEQPWFGDDGRTVTARSLQGQVERGGHVLGLHRRAKLPGDDMPAVIVEDGRQVEPAPWDAGGRARAATGV